MDGRVSESTQPSFRDALELQSGHVHIWRARLDQPAAVVGTLNRTLSDDERARAVRFRSDRHRERFIVCRAAQRQVLARYTGVRPEVVGFQYSTHGKPSLDMSEHGRHVRFNTSNSGDLAVFAVAAEREVGVDVEVDRSVRDALALARRFFSSAEFEALRALPAESRQQAFLTCWTRKEAFVKAVGLGVTMPLSSFDVGVGPEVAALLSTRPDPGEAQRWSMHSLDAGPGYYGALVVEGTVEATRFFDWQPTLPSNAR